jgi:Caspase domain
VLFVYWHLQPSCAQDIKPWYTTTIDDEKTALSINIGGKTQSLYSESHALLIGEVNYAAWPQLTAIPGELGQLTKALERQHFKVEVHFDLNSDTMMKVIDQFVRIRGTVPESRMFIYVAAHGYSREIIGGRRLGYILPIDSPENGSADARIIGKALPLTMFAAWSQTPDPRHMFMIFDSCFSGAFFGYVGRLMDPGVAPNIQYGAPNGMGFRVEGDGQIIGPPPLKSGIESTNFAVLDPQERSPGRQFLAAGDSNETVPGKSILARLLVSILDDKITQVTTDYWTTGEEIGNWIRRNSPNIARALFSIGLPPTPVYGRLPHDDIYQQGDMVFLRYDQEGIPVVSDPDDKAVWDGALSKPILTDDVLTAGAEKRIHEARQEAAHQAAIAAAAEARYRDFSVVYQQQQQQQQNYSQYTFDPFRSHRTPRSPQSYSSLFENYFGPNSYFDPDRPRVSRLLLLQRIAKIRLRSWRYGRGDTGCQRGSSAGAGCQRSC